MENARLHLMKYTITFSMVLAIFACNNPFQTRESEKPGAGGVAIKPANTPENVLYNLEAAFENLSIQDYLDVFTDDFAFHPDPDDSLLYEQEFIGGWDVEKETMFANNFLLRQNFVEVDGNPIELNASYEYMPGQEYYEYHYHMFIPLLAITGGGYGTIEIEGYAFLYLREDDEGNWSVYGWEDHRLVSHSLTWGALRAQHI
ncbi:hypothetical protein ACFL5H_01910 [Candidatus Latescibacterota bacterium]